MSTPRCLILNSPWEVPTGYWQEDRGRLSLAEGRRSAGYEIFDTRNNTRRADSLVINAHGGFGVWSRDVAFEMAEI